MLVKAFSKNDLELGDLSDSWDQVLQVNGKSLPPNQELPMAYFLVKRGLLYYHCNHWGEPCDLFHVPRSKIVSLMHLAHAS